MRPHETKKCQLVVTPESRHAALTATPPSWGQRFHARELVSLPARRLIAGRGGPGSLRRLISRAIGIVELLGLRTLAESLGREDAARGKRFLQLPHAGCRDVGFGQVEFFELRELRQLPDSHVSRC